MTANIWFLFGIVGRLVKPTLQATHYRTGGRREGERDREGERKKEKLDGGREGGKGKEAVREASDMKKER